MAEERLPKLAYLGPVGTYSHQGAYDKFGDNVEYVERQKVRDVFDAVSPDIPYGLVPQENSIFGAVTETYDMLRQPDVGQTKFIRGEVTLAVQHCLIVRHGVKREDITRILSHEQALGQCAHYLSEHFPKAALQKMASTAAAAQALIDEEADNPRSAAICSPLCAKVFNGLEILQEGIQDTNINYTRFFILATGLDVQPPYVPSRRTLERALVRVALPTPEPEEDEDEDEDTEVEAEDDDTAIPGADQTPESAAPATYSHNRPLHLVMSTLLTTFGVPVIRIDRRPSLNPVPFEQTYFIELEELGSGFADEVGPHGGSAWLTRVQMGVDRALAAGAQAAIIGVW